MSSDVVFWVSVVFTAVGWAAIIWWGRRVDRRTTESEVGDGRDS